ncbi:single-stranded DNA-binding protein, partial [Bacillus anthracis]
FGNQSSNPFGQSSNSGNQGNQGNSGFTKNDDPFSNVGQPIDISDDDLPF